MAVLQYQCSMSLDGFIAGPDGDMSWLGEFMAEESPTESAMMRSVAARTAALLQGANTFFGDDPNAGTDSEGAYGGTWDGPQFVLTHRRIEHPVPGVEFHTDLHAAARAALAAADAAGPDRTVGVLGAGIARQYIDAGLVGELYVSVLPILLGDGVPLFRRSGPPVRLTPLATEETPSTTSRIYRVQT